MNEKLISVKDRLPDDYGCYLVYAPKSFPKNSRFVVASYYLDNKSFYSESGDSVINDVTHWCELPDDPQEQ